MGRFGVGLVLGLLIPPAAGFLFVKAGGMPVATHGDPLPFERFLAKTALRAAMKDERDKQAPIEATDEALTAGARIYQEDCAVCHGLPGQPPTAIAKGMFPRPPQLFVDDEMVTDDPEGSVFWKAKFGIRLTGMPGFGDGLVDQQLWQVTLLLTHADDLPATASALLTPTPGK